VEWEGCKLKAADKQDSREIFGIFRIWKANSPWYWEQKLWDLKGAIFELCYFKIGPGGERLSKQLDLSKRTTSPARLLWLVWWACHSALGPQLRSGRLDDRLNRLANLQNRKALVDHCSADRSEIEKSNLASNHTNVS